MKRLALLVLAVLLAGALGCQRNTVSDQEMEDLMMKHRPGYAEGKKRQEQIKAGGGAAPAVPLNRRP